MRLLNKRDLVTIVVLTVIFLAMATWNLGNSIAPQTSAEFSPNQSFYVDLGTVTEVKSVVYLLKDVRFGDGKFTLTVSTGSFENGSIGNWQQVSSQTVNYDYYKWKEVSVQRNTQFVKFEFNGSSNPVISEIGAISQANQTLPITSTNNLGTGTPALSSLVDEQDTIQYPATYMSQTYFDEIYFVRTAEQYLHKEFPYEWTHPPLGKLIQAASIVVAGFNPFGWRIVGVLFATLMIPVIYAIGKKLLGTWIGGFAAAFLLTFDFMHFSMGRMGTADTYVVFFSLLSQLCFLYYFMNVLQKGWQTSVKPLFLAVVFFALGFSTKWLVIYSAVGMLAILAAVRIKDIGKIKEGLGAKYAAFFDHPFLLLMGFFGVAIGIYFLTYIPDMWIGRPLLGTYGNGIIDLQGAMYGYHANLNAAHDFASPWWSWPFLVNPGHNPSDLLKTGYVPLWLESATVVSPGILRSTISAFGNPAVWWVGFASIIAIALDAMKSGELASYIRVKITGNVRKIVKRIRTKMGKKDKSPQVQQVAPEVVILPNDGLPKIETLPQSDVLPSVEVVNVEDETKTRLRRSIMTVVGFLVFVVTAMLAELLNYHSFLLALPLYLGMMMATYGMVSRLKTPVDAKDFAPIFITMIFFFSWIPYVFISRVTFIYHFYVAMPCLCLASAYLVSKYWHTKGGKIATIILFAAVVALFVVFFPVISGVPASDSYLDNLKWFPSWYF